MIFRHNLRNFVLSSKQIDKQVSDNRKVVRYIESNPIPVKVGTQEKRRQTFFFFFLGKKCFSNGPETESISSESWLLPTFLPILLLCKINIALIVLLLGLLNHCAYPRCPSNVTILGMCIHVPARKIALTQLLADDPLFAAFLLVGLVPSILLTAIADEPRRTCKVGL